MTVLGSSCRQSGETVYVVPDAHKLYFRSSQTVSYLLYNLSQKLPQEAYFRLILLKCMIGWLHTQVFLLRFDLS